MHFFPPDKVHNKAQSLVTSATSLRSFVQSSPCILDEAFMIHQTGVKETGKCIFDRKLYYYSLEMKVFFCFENTGGQTSVGVVMVEPYIKIPHTGDKESLDRCG